MYVCDTSQAGSTINSHSNVLFLFCFVTRYFYLLVSDGNLTVVAIKTDESVTPVHMVRINKQEANSGTFRN